MLAHMKKLTQFRQGDILLKPIDSIPEDAKRIQPESGRLILARGEATGHHHSIEGVSGSTALLATPDKELYLLVQEGEALLEHQEHATISLAPGKYKVVRQREYSPTEIRRVQD